ncbi:MAG: bifunctional heptose 7-phosphate kinase/heptose 1-phosphate adenyltransferase [Promethearchaeota archaeon]
MMETKVNYDELFSNVRNKKVLVIGDAAIDKYISGSTTRISPDSPVPVVDVQKKEFFLGGVGRVVKFILGFGADVQICTAVGDDFEGEFFTREVSNFNLGLKGIIKEDCFTPQITRIKSRGQHMLRLEKRYELSKDQIKNVNSKASEFLDGVIDKVDVVLVLDYGMGLFRGNFELVGAILSRARERDVKVIVRPDKENYRLFTDVYISKINLNLAASIVGMNPVNETSIRIIGNKMLNDIKCCGLYLSYLDENSYLLSGDEFITIPRVLKHHGTSYIGAGSAIMATLAVMTAAGADRETAIRVANVAGALSATKPPVTFFPLKELREAFESGALDE